MVFGVLKDIKEGENRVICTPIEVASIVAAGHTVLAQRDCGVGSGFSNEKYVEAGAEIVDTMEEMYARCDFLAKVKELFPCEYDLLRKDQLVYCCIHPAGHPEEVDAILAGYALSTLGYDLVTKRHNLPGNPHCLSPFRHAHVTWNGDVTYCTDFYDFRAGNVKDTSLLAIFGNERSDAWRGLIAEGGCPTCRHCSWKNNTNYRG